MAGGRRRQRPPTAGVVRAKRRDAQLFDRAQDIGHNTVARGVGVSPGWAAAGGTTGCLLNRNLVLQFETAMLRAGVTADELARYRDLMLSGARFRARSDSGVVTATVDWQMELVSVDIGVVLTRIRGTALAPQLVQAINRARAAAIAELTRVSCIHDANRLVA